MSFNTTLVYTFTTNTPTGPYFSNSICPDQYLCDIYYANHKWNVSNKNLICSRRFSHTNNQNLFVDYPHIPLNNYLILLLESPHIDEYDSNQNAYGPAQGKTGCNICYYLEDCLNNLRSPIVLNIGIRYRLVLMNAIQFQCSLGFSPINPTTRDSIWLWLMTQNNYNDIDRRLNCFLSLNTNCVVVNCCTKKLKPNLNVKVASITTNYYYGHHPSCWCFSSLRYFWK